MCVWLGFVDLSGQKGETASERERNLRERCWLTVKNAANRLICFLKSSVASVRRGRHG